MVGKPCSYRDRKVIAIEAAEYLKRVSGLRRGGEASPERGSDSGGVQASRRHALMLLNMRPTGGHSPASLGVGVVPRRQWGVLHLAADAASDRHTTGYSHGPRVQKSVTWAVCPRDGFRKM